MVTGLALFYLTTIAILSWIAAGSICIYRTTEDSYRPKTSINSSSGNECYMGDLFEASIGISILNLCDLDLASKTFYSEGMLWLKYAKLPEWLDHWDREIIECPVKALRFVNNVERHDLDLELEPATPVQDSDGLFIQWVKFSGRFVANKLDLRRFPFETIRLPIEVELEDMYSSETNLSYRQSGALVASGGELTGYRLKHTCVFESVHQYPTNWGWNLAVACNGKENFAEFDNIRACIDYTRSIRSSLLNIFLPLAVMVCVVLCVPLLDIHQHENRVVIPASVLLVLVFLQDGYKKILPAGLSYPTLADLIYTSCFVLTIGVFVSGVMTANAYLSAIQNTDAVTQMLNSQSHLVFLINIAYLSLVIPILIAITGQLPRRQDQHRNLRSQKADS
jgi:hypothetical protein